MSHRRFPPRPHPTSIRLSKEDKKRLDKRAEKLGQYPTALIQWIITTWLDEQDRASEAKKNPPIEPPLPSY